jgi:predicted amidohydrolase YtcJ
MNTRALRSLFLGLLAIGLLDRSAVAQEADLILRNGKIVTVDPDFSIWPALAIKGDRLIRVGREEDVLLSKGPETRVIDLQGKTVVPGLIDSHVHPTDACMIEFDHPIPQMETIQDVLDYIKSRTEAVEPGQWIVVRQVFITRLREQRYPTKAELDQVAPKNPVLFATGPDASLNSLALQLSGIDKNFKVSDGEYGFAEKDPKTGEPTGILRSCTRYVKTKSTAKKPSQDDEDRRLIELLKDYNSVGFTGIIDRDTDPSAVDQYRRLHEAGRLPIRVAMSHHVETAGPIEKIQENIRKVAANPLCKGGPMLRIVGIKTYLDGGMLTGSAYMREPWGVSKIYSIDDPTYRGVLFIPHDRLLPIVRTTVESGLQYTAHTVGDGAVHALIDVYEELSHSLPIAKTRPCITHSNFMSRESVEKAAKLGVVVDIQPAWLYLDGRTLLAQFGYDRLRYFQPLRSLFALGVIAGGGSDHMQKIGSLRSINFYNPFWAMWVTVSRRAKGYEGRLHPEEALSREQALKFYTINNAHLLFLEDQIGSLEPGKLADLAILDRDILTCPEDSIKDTQVLSTYLNGKEIYTRKP